MEDFQSLLHWMLIGHRHWMLIGHSVGHLNIIYLNLTLHVVRVILYVV